MKKALFLALFGAAAAGAYGQGFVYFNNSPVTVITTNTVPGGPATGPISGSAGSYYFGLFVAPANVSDLGQFTFTGVIGTNTSAEGRFSGNTNGYGVAVSGYMYGTTANFLVRGWSANIGHDYSAVTAYLANPTFDAWYGHSQIATVLLGGDFPPSGILFGPGRMAGFNLDFHAIPEPSSLALVGAGLFFLVTLARTPRRGSS